MRTQNARCWAVFAVLAGNSAVVWSAEHLSAQQILDSLSTKYAKLSTYADEALVNGTVFTAPVHARVHTIYAAPASLLVSVVTENGFQRLYLMDGTAVREWSPEAGWDDLKGLSQFMSRVKGTTALLGRSAHWTTSLLLPGRGTGATLTHLDQARRVPNAELGGAQCYRIDGFIGGDEIRLWIGIEDLLIRRIETDGSTAQATVDYRPRIDTDVKPSDIRRMAASLATR